MTSTGLRALSRRYAMPTAIILLTCLAAAAAGSLLERPSFTSTTRAFVSTASAATTADLSQGSTFTQQIIASYAQVATAPSVLNRVRAQLGLQESEETLSRQVSANASPSTVIIEIQAVDKSPTRAADIANSVLKNLQQVVAQINPRGSSAATDVRITPIEAAVPARVPSSPNLLVNLVLALLLGSLLSGVFAYLDGRFNTTARSESDISSLLSEPVIGRISRSALLRDGHLVVGGPEGRGLGEAYRSLAANLHFLNPAAKSQAYVITSAMPEEGKSTCAANLAIALSESGRSVLLVEGDLRRPRVAAYLGLAEGIGLTDVLVGDCDLPDAVQTWGGGALRVLPAGSLPPNPAQLLQSPPMQVLLRELVAKFEIVLFDAAPILPVADGAILASYADGVLLVSGLGKVQRGQIAAAHDALGQAGASVLGVIVNFVPPEALLGGRYGYSYESYASS